MDNISHQNFIKTFVFFVNGLVNTKINLNFVSRGMSTQTKICGSIGTNMWIWSNGRSVIDLHNLMDNESWTMTQSESRKKTYDSVSTFIIEMIIGKHTQFLINPNKILG